MRTFRISDPRLISVHKPSAKRYGSFHDKQLLGMLEKHTTYACSCSPSSPFFSISSSIEINVKITCDYLLCQESIVLLGGA